MVRHLMARWKESGEPEPTAINEVEELAMRHRKLTSSSTSFLRPENTRNGIEKNSGDDEFSSSSEEEVDKAPGRSDDESDERNMAIFEK